MRLSGPWFEVDLTSLEFNSILINQPTYLFSFAQIRFTATSDSQLTYLKYTPTAKTFVDTAKAIAGKNRATKVGVSISMNPGVQFDHARGGSSGLETTQNQWAIATQTTETSAEGKNSENIFWRYTYNDAWAGQLQNWSYEPTLLPSAIFTTSRLGPAPVVEAEVMVLWSDDSEGQHAKRRGFFPLRSAAGAEHQKSSVFANFIYQVAVKVDLNDVKDERSDVIVGGLADTSTWDELRQASVAKRGTTHFEPIKRTAEKDCDLDPENGVATHCHVFIHRAIEGRVFLSDEEKKGRGFLCSLRSGLLTSVIEYFAGLPISIQISVPPSPGAASLAGLLTPSPSPSPSPPLPTGRDPASKKSGSKFKLSRLTWR